MSAESRRTRYTYDDARRLTDVTFADGTGSAFRFDELGRRVSEASSTHSRTLSYDAVGRVERVTDGLTGAVVTSGYDAEGRRTLVSEGGVDRRYEYDARGLLRRLKLGTGGWLEVTHDALGRRTSVTRPNGVRSDWLFDEAGQLTAVLHTKAGVVVEGFSYTYDTHGMRVSKTRFDGTSERYGYDAADRLVAVDESSGRSSRYALDWVGNRTSLAVAQGPQVTTTTSVSNAFNQLTSSNRSGGGLPFLSTAYVYDVNGNLTSETGGTAATTYTWDADNRLRQLAQPGALHSYEYDANGLRTKKVETGVETRFLLEGQSVLAEFDSANAATRRYLQNPESIDDILEFTEGGAAYFPLTDALGSVVSITDSAGAVVRRNSYEVYGARSSTGSGPDWPFGFSGREQDVSGWRYHRDRYASAGTGTWSQADRGGDVDGPSRYLYVGATPSSSIDPEGMKIVWHNPTGAKLKINPDDVSALARRQIVNNPLVAIWFEYALATKPSCTVNRFLDFSTLNIPVYLLTSPPYEGRAQTRWDGVYTKMWPGQPDQSIALELDVLAGSGASVRDAAQLLIHEVAHFIIAYGMGTSTASFMIKRPYEAGSDVERYIDWDLTP